MPEENNHLLKKGLIVEKFEGGKNNEYVMLHVHEWPNVT